MIATFTGTAVGTPMELRYGFDFYRISYLFDFWKDPRNELAAGISLQMRNAVIVFADKTVAHDRQSTKTWAPCPILKFREALPSRAGWWLGSEVDGFYASGRCRDHRLGQVTSWRHPGRLAARGHPARAGRWTCS